MVTEESWSSLTSGSRNTQRFLLLLLALGVAVPAIVVAIGLKRVMRPVEELKRAAKEVARGNFGQTIAVRSGDEIEELADEFNAMAVQLQSSYGQLEQRVAERTEELRVSETRYRELFEESRDAIFVSAADGKVVAANPAALDLFGFALDDAIGSDLSDRFVDKSDRERFRDALAPMGSVREFEVRLRKRDGSQIDCLMTAVRRVDAAGNNIGIQGVIRDITESKKAEAAALEQMREVAVLGERNRMAREIHDTMAQGFTGIVLQMEAAEQSLDGNSQDLADHLDRARSLAREGLQEARRSVWGLLPQALEQNTLDGALQNEIQRFEAGGAEKVAFSLTGISRELPTDAQTVLLRICQESLANVRRHAKAGEVTVDLDYQEREVSLKIVDNGVGFDSIAQKGKRGLSFGLIGMQQRAQQLNGQLRVSSTEGQGTTVELTVPAS